METDSNPHPCSERSLSTLCAREVGGIVSSLCLQAGIWAAWVFREREDLLDGPVIGSLGVGGQSPFLYLLLMRSFLTASRDSWQPLFQKDTLKSKAVQR